MSEVGKVLAGAMLAVYPIAVSLDGSWDDRTRFLTFSVQAYFYLAAALMGNFSWLAAAAATVVTDVGYFFVLKDGQQPEKAS